MQEVIHQTNSIFEKSWECSHLKSELCRTQLDIEGWHSNLLKAKKRISLNSSNKESFAMLCNSLAVVSLAKGNKEDHKRYLLETINYIDKTNPDKHAVFPNYIDNLLLTHEESKYEDALNNYKILIDFEDPQDTLAWYNYLIVFHRQKNEPLKVCQLIDEMDHLINNKFSLSESERAIFTVSGLRMRFNGNCDWKYNFAIFVSNINYYLDLPQETAAIVSKELFGIMVYQQRKGQSFNKIDEVLDALIKFLKGYYKVIDEKTDTLRLEFVNERCAVIKEKADIITKIVDERDNEKQIGAFKSKIRLYKDVVEIYLEEVDKANELFTRLLIIDEICALDYSTVLAPEITRIRHMELYNNFLKELKSQLEKSWSLLIRNGFEYFEYHPELNDKMLILSYYIYRELGDLKRSKVLLEKFENAGVGIHHYALWLRNYFDELKIIHSKVY